MGVVFVVEYDGGYVDGVGVVIDIDKDRILVRQMRIGGGVVQNDGGDDGAVVVMVLVFMAVKAPQIKGGWRG